MAASIPVDASIGRVPRIFPDRSEQVFDAEGRQIAVLDALGNTTRYTYLDTTGDGFAESVATIVDPVGLVTTFNYAGGRLVSIADPAGRVTSLLHSPAGHLVGFVNPDGTVRRFEYDPRGRMSAQTDLLGQKRHYTYGSSERIATVTRADGSVYSYRSQLSNGAVAAAGDSLDPLDPSDVEAYTSLDPRGNPVAQTLDAAGQPTGTLDALGKRNRGLSIIRDSRLSELKF